MAIEWVKARLPFQESLIDVEMVVAFRECTTQNVTNCPAYYLQGMRNGVLRAVPSSLALREASYLKAVPRVIEDLLTAFSDRGVQHAALVVPPSSRNDARPYADALLKAGIATVDLSGCVKRIESSFRAGQSVSFEEVRSSIEVVKRPEASAFGSLIVVDDVLSSGRSVAAVVLSLQESSFILKSSRIFIAAVLSVEREAREELIGEGMTVCHQDPEDGSIGLFQGTNLCWLRILGFPKRRVSAQRLFCLHTHHHRHHPYSAGC